MTERRLNKSHFGILTTFHLFRRLDKYTKSLHFLRKYNQLKRFLLVELLMKHHKVTIYSIINYPVYLFFQLLRWCHTNLFQKLFMYPNSVIAYY
jgi:hypothetical protein